jgi:ABC-type sugar transport system substrate-binding protein
MVHAANRASTPIVIYNRRFAPNEGSAVSVLADNYQIAKATVEYMAQTAEESGGKYKAMVLIGTLADTNAINRLKGFEDAVAAYDEIIEIVARVPTDWRQDKALSGVTNALQANPDINFVFSSSDFLFPSLISALKTAGKYKKIGEKGHVLLGGFDGDSMAYQMLVDGYLDADGVQDVYFECNQSVEAVLGMLGNKQEDKVIKDPGFVIHQGNLEEMSSRMWGARVTAQGK